MNTGNSAGVLKDRKQNSKLVRAARVVCEALESRYLMANGPAHRAIDLVHFTSGGDVRNLSDTPVTAPKDFPFTGGTAFDAVRQADGKIITAGTFGGNFALARWTADGRLDQTFSSDGKVTFNAGTTSDKALGVALQPDGKILAMGTRSSGSDLRFTVARFNSDGSIDTSFASQGQLTTPIGVKAGPGSAAAVLDDGSVIVIGAGEQGKTTALRYEGAGKLDEDFGSMRPQSAASPSIEEEPDLHASLAALGNPVINLEVEPALAEVGQVVEIAFIDEDISGAEILEWTIDWGDGNEESYETNELDFNEQIGRYVASHSYADDDPGTPRISVSVTLDSAIVGEDELDVVQVDQRSVVIANSLLIHEGGTLELDDNDLIILTENGASAGAIEDYVASGFNNGDWLGTGISSFAAHLDTNFVTALGVVDNALIGYTEFSGIEGLVGTEVLVKYTYYGDADLNGSVNLDDFNQFLFGYNNGAGGPPAIWLNGDFDYNESINLDDFNQFLFGSQNQGAPFDDDDLEEEWLDTVRATHDQGLLPPAPSNLAAENTSFDIIDLEWVGHSESETEFEIEVSSDDGETWELIGRELTDGTEFSVEGLDDQIPHEFRVRAVNENGPSDYTYSEPIELDFQGPTSLGVDEITPTTVTLSFVDNSASETGYELEQWIGGAWIGIHEFEDTTEEKGIQTYTVLDLDADQSHRFRVRTLGSTGMTNETTVTTLPPALDIGEPTEEVVAETGGTPFILNLDAIGIEADDLTWTIHWGDESEPTEVEPNEDRSVEHEYPEDPASYVILVTALQENVQGAPTYEIAKYVSIISPEENSPLRRVLDAFEYVYNNIDYQPYDGLMKGPDATEDTKAGNAWDQAALLVQKLQELETPPETRFYWGRMGRPAADIVRWLGAKDEVAAQAILEQAKLSPILQDGILSFNHAWVNVNFDNIDASGWHQFDPTWKFKDLPAKNRSVVDDLPDEAPFDSAEADEYLNQTRELPLEYYEGVITKHFRDNDVSDISLADVAYDGSIIAKQFATVPPFDTTAYTPDSAFTGEKVNGDLSIPTKDTHRVRITLSRPLEYSDIIEVPVVYAPNVPEEVSWIRVQLTGYDQLIIDEIVLLDSEGQPIDLTSATARQHTPNTNYLAANAKDELITTSSQTTAGPQSYWEIDLGESTEVASIEIHRKLEGGVNLHKLNNFYVIGLGSEVADPSLDTALAAARFTTFVGTRLLRYTLNVPSVSTSAISVSYASDEGKLRPQLRVGDSIVASGGKIDHGSDVFIRIEHLDREEIAEIADQETHFDETSEALHDGFFDPYDGFVKAFKYQKMAGEPFAIGLGALQTSEQGLLELQRRLNDTAARRKPDLVTYQHELLSFTALKYFHELHKQREGISGLTQRMLVAGEVESGIVVGDRDFEPLDSTSGRFDLQNPIIPRKMATDIANLSAHLVPLAGSFVLTSPQQKDVQRLHGFAGSALEHYVIESVTNAEAISTIKGFQLAGAALPPITDVSQIHHNLFGTDKAAKEARESITHSVNAGFTVTVVPNKILLPFWRGVVWIQERVVTNEAGTRIDRNYVIKRDGESPSNGASAATDPQDVQPIENPHSLVAGDPVEVLTGNMTHDEQDISIPNKGIPLVFARHYNSTSNEQYDATLPEKSPLKTKQDVGLGIGWGHTYSDYLTLNATATEITWHTGTGEHHEFTKSGTSFINPGGLFGTFSLTGGAYSFRRPDGLTKKFVNLGIGPNPWRLDEISDRYGNKLKMEYEDGLLTRVHDYYNGVDTGRQIKFLYSAAHTGHIEQVYDFTMDGANNAALRWEYTYDQMTGKHDGRFLRTVTSPSDANTEPLRTHYEYHKDGRLAGLMKFVHNLNTGARHFFNYYSNRRAFSTTDAIGTAAFLADPEKPLTHTEYFSYELLEYTQSNPDNLPDFLSTHYVDPLGRVTTYEFDTKQSFQTKRIIHPDRSRTDNKWDNFLLTETSDDMGHFETFAYDTTNPDLTERGNLLTHVKTLSDAESLTTTYTYEEPHNGVKTITRSGPGFADRVTTYTYNGTGDVTHIENAAGNKTDFEYPTASRGLPDKLIRPKGIDTPENDYFTSYLYNDAGQVKKETTDLPSVVEYIYDDRGDLKKTIDAELRVVEHEYDLLHHLLKTTVDPIVEGNGLNLITIYTYVDGRLAQTQDPREQHYKTRYGYDKVGRLIVTVHPDKSTAEITYDAVGNVSATMDESRRVTRFVHDAHNRRIQTLYGDGGFARVRYDGAGRVVSTATPLNDVTPLGLDDVAQTKQAYDLGDRLITVTDAIGQINTYGYNVFGDLTLEKFFTPGDPAVLWRDTHYHVDNLGRVDERRGNDGIVTATAYDENGNVIEVRQYDVTGEDPLTVPDLDELDSQATYTTFDVLDRPIEVKDTLLNVTATTYDLSGLVKTVTDPRGTATTQVTGDFMTSYFYDGAGRLLREVFPQITLAEGTAIPATDYVYDEAGNLLTRKDGKLVNAVVQGNTTSYAYDSRNRRNVIVEPEQEVKAVIVYHPSGEVRYEQIWVLDPGPEDDAIRETEHRYDIRGRKVSEIQPDPDTTDSEPAPQLHWFYNAAGELVAALDGTDRGTFSKYDALHREIESRPAARGASIIKTGTGPWYAEVTLANHGLSTSTSVNIVVAFASDPAYNGTFTVTKIDDNKFTYLLPAEPASESEAEALIAFPATHSRYLHNDLLRVTDPRGYKREYFYDKNNQFGRRMKETVSTGTNFNPDTAIPPTPASAFEVLSEWTYDSFGNVLSEKRHISGTSSMTTNYVYDGLNRKIKETGPDPDGAGTTHVAPVTRWGYDEVGNVVYVIDPKGSKYITDNGATEADLKQVNLHTMTYSYDAFNRVFEEAQADPDAVSLSNLGATLDPPVTEDFYDEHGNLTKRTDPADNVTTFTYDVLNRLETETTTAYLNPTDDSENVTRIYEYNEFGNLKEITDRNGRLRTFKYDHLDRQTDEYWGTEQSHSEHFSFVYDEGGRLTSDGDRTYTYDPRGRLINEIIGGVYKLIHKYDAAGNRTTVQVRPAEVGQTVEQLNHSYQYDHLNRMIRSTQTDVADFSGDTLVPGKQALFSYNRLGQYTDIVRRSDWEMGGGFFADIGYSSYGYDLAGRLETLDHGWAEYSESATYGYEYDLLDRITNFSVEGDNRTYNYDGNDQLTDDDGTAYTYDENGNRTIGDYETGADNRLISDGVYEYLYDAEGNRIAKVVGDVEFDIDENPYPTSVGSSAVTYHYDHRNRLVEVISLELEQAGMIETRSIYTYDVDDRRDYRFNLDETQTATEERVVYDGSLPLVVWDDVNQFYLYGASGEVLAQEDAASGASWPLADHQQSVRKVLDATGSDVAEENDYDAFGNSTNGDFAFRVTHHGGELERLTKLIHMGPRVLDTTTNGFLQQDAAGETTHPTAYARNNPVNRHDRSGYFSAAHGIAWPTISAAAQEQAFPAPGRVSYGNPWLTSADRAASADLRSYWQADFERQQMAFADRIAGIDEAIAQARYSQAAIANWQTMYLDTEFAPYVDPIEKGLRWSSAAMASGVDAAASWIEAQAVGTENKYLAFWGGYTAQNLRTVASIANLPGYAVSAMDDLSGYHAAGVGGYDALVNTGLRRVPFVSSFVSGYEAAVGESTAGADLGRSLSGTERWQRGLGATGEVSLGMAFGSGSIRQNPSVGAYRDVGGHHVHAQRAFQGLHGYDSYDAFAISDALIRSRGGVHIPNMTTYQRRLFSNLADDVTAGVRQNTMREHTRIAVEVLRSGGFSNYEARQLAAQSLRHLKVAGVRQPAGIPWNQSP